MRLVGDHHDVRPRAQRGQLLVLFGQKLLDRGEDHAPAGHLQQVAQLLAAVRLHRRLPQDLVAPLELAEKLVVQVVAVRQHHQRRVLHGRMPHDLPRVEQHGKALAAALRMPHHARPAVARLPAVHAPRPIGPRRLAHRAHPAHAARPDRLRHRRVHRVVLVVARDDLVQPIAFGVLFEHDEIPQQVEEPPLLEYPADQDFELQRRLGRIALAVDRPPHLEPLRIRRQRTNPRIGAVRQHQHLVVVEQRPDLLLVGLQLLVCAPDRRLLVRRVLQLDHPQRQPVHEHHDVRTPVVLALDHRELVRRQPVVRIDVLEIRQPDEIARDAPVLAAILHRHSVPQHRMERPVRLRQRGRPHPQHLAERLLLSLVGNLRIQPPNRRLQPPRQNHLAERIPLRRRLPRCHVRPMPDAIPQLPEPSQGRVFDDGFVQAHVGIFWPILRNLAARSPGAEKTISLPRLCMFSSPLDCNWSKSFRAV